MVGAALESSRQVSNEAVSAIAARLSRLPLADDLKLPGQLTRNGAAVSVETRNEYLTKLIVNDPGVFLERHGDMLEAEECAAFHHLRSSSYEVDFHLKVLEDRRKDPPQGINARSTQIKNRRLAAMRSLLLEGEHFSEEAMRQRQPYLYHLYVGQYSSHHDEREGNNEDEERGRAMDTRDVPGSTEGSTLARSLMRQQEEIDLMVRRKEEKERYALIEREQEEEDDSEDEDVGKEKLDGNRDSNGSGKKEEREGEGIAGRDGPDSRSELVQAVLMEQQAAHPESSHPSVYGDPSGERISQEEREKNLESFRDIMQQKFLAGEDTEIDYVAIDANQELDVSEEAVRDAEEAYFDAD